MLIKNFMTPEFWYDLPQCIACSDCFVFYLVAPILQKAVFVWYTKYQKIDGVIFLHLDFFQAHIDQVKNPLECCFIL